MPRNGAFIDKIAQFVSDGGEVDWAELESAAQTPEELAMVRNLRVVANISFGHQTPQDVDLHVSPTIMRTEPTVESDTDPESAAPGEPRAWGPFRIIEKVGEGAFGGVYKAWDNRLDCEVALKLLNARRKDGDLSASVLDETGVIEEGRLMARVRHQNVVNVYGADKHEGQVGLWMEFVRGSTLSGLVEQQGPMGAREAAGIGADLCRALAAVHKAGLIHRDVKAQNVMREEGGRILLMDFSAGREVQEEGVQKNRRVSGTPLYMPPEAFTGADPTPGTDIYSLGILLYHLVTGGYPITAKSMKELKAAHANREARLLRDERPDLPAGFIEVVEKATAWDTGSRYASAGQMEQALRGVLAGLDVPAPAAPERSEETSPALHPLRPFPRWLVPVAGAAVMALAVGLYLFGPWGSSSESQSRVAQVRPPTSGTPGEAGFTSSTEQTAAGAQDGGPGSPAGDGIGPGGGDPAAPPGGSDGVGGGPSSWPAGTNTGAGEPGTISVGSPAPQPAAPAGSGVTPLLPPYSVEASLLRVNGATHEVLLPGSRVTVGDRVALKFRGSTSLYVYVLNEDEIGNAYVLFPMRGSDLRNPLPPHRDHLLPGREKLLDGSPENQIYWQSDSAGGREHFLIIASPMRLADLERDLADLDAPLLDGSPDPGPPKISQASVGTLRGFGRKTVAPRPETIKLSGPLHIYELYEELSARAESARGVWARQIVLENPPVR